MANIFLEKVILRPLEKEDKDQIHKFRNDGEITHLLGGFSVGYSRQAIEEKIENWGNSHNTIMWAVAEKETNKCIGHIGLYDIDYVSRRAEIGMLIGEKQYWGQGIGLGITETVTDFAFKQLNIHSVQAKVLETNLASLRVFNKLGFKKDGKIRDFQFRNGDFISAVLLSILDKEWKEK